MLAKNWNTLSQSFLNEQPKTKAQRRICSKFQHHIPHYHLESFHLHSNKAVQDNRGAHFLSQSKRDQIIFSNQKNSNQCRVIGEVSHTSCNCLLSSLSSTETSMHEVISCSTTVYTPMRESLLSSYVNKFLWHIELKLF